MKLSNALALAFLASIPVLAVYAVIWFKAFRYMDGTGKKQLALKALALFALSFGISSALIMFNGIAPIPIIPIFIIVIILSALFTRFQPRARSSRKTSCESIGTESTSWDE